MLGRDIHQNLMQAPVLPGSTSQTLAVTGTSAQSAALQAGARLVRLVATDNVHVVAGANPTATTSSTLLIGGQEAYFAVAGGEKIAAIGAAGVTAASLNITAF